MCNCDRDCTTKCECPHHSWSSWPFTRRVGDIDRLTAAANNQDQHKGQPE